MNHNRENLECTGYSVRLSVGSQAVTVVKFGNGAPERRHEQSGQRQTLRFSYPFPCTSEPDLHSNLPLVELVIIWHHAVERALAITQSFV